MGAEGRERLIASTLDVVFVVSAFATTEKLERRSLNPRRMERCVAAVREGSGTPVAVLNKADLPRHDSEELGDVRRELSARLGVNVVCVNAETRLGLDELRQHLTPDDTVAFVGPSGVGKSSLINVLLDQPALDVDRVRQTDAKGRHTTSHRELLIIPGGALLVDTPGMREFVVLSASGETTGFDDIQALASACRFSDCAHETEPGCAVVAATERGELLADRLASFHALQRDARRLQAKHGALVRHITHKKGPEVPTAGPRSDGPQDTITGATFCALQALLLRPWRQRAVEHSLVVLWGVDIRECAIVLGRNVQSPGGMRSHHRLRAVLRIGRAQFVEQRSIEEHRMPVASVALGTHKGSPGASIPVQHRSHRRRRNKRQVDKGHDDGPQLRAIDGPQRDQEGRQLPFSRVQVRQ